MVEEYIYDERTDHLVRVQATDLLRTAVVFSVSGMDAYYTDRFCEILIPFLKKNRPGPSLVALLSDAGLDTQQALELLAMKRPFRRIRSLVQTHLDMVVTQRFEKIDDVFICVGIQKFCANAQGLTGRKGLLRSVELLVERRHQIVHEGDLNDYGRLRTLKPETTLQRILDLMDFVGASETLLNQALKPARRKQKVAV